MKNIIEKLSGTNFSKLNISLLLLAFLFCGQSIFAQNNNSSKEEAKKERRKQFWQQVEKSVHHALEEKYGYSQEKKQSNNQTAKNTQGNKNTYSTVPAASSTKVTRSYAEPVIAAPSLQSPTSNAVLPNACENGAYTRQYQWTRVPDAEVYELTTGIYGVPNSEISYNVYSTFQAVTSARKIADDQLFNHYYSVRAKVNGKWGPTSQKVYFNVQKCPEIVVQKTEETPTYSAPPSRPSSSGQTTASSSSSTSSSTSNYRGCGYQITITAHSITCLKSSDSDNDTEYYGTITAEIGYEDKVLFNNTRSNYIQIKEDEYYSFTSTSGSSGKCASTPANYTSNNQNRKHSLVVTTSSGNGKVSGLTGVEVTFTASFKDKDKTGSDDELGRKKHTIAVNELEEGMNYKKMKLKGKHGDETLIGYTIEVSKK